MRSSASESAVDLNADRTRVRPVIGGRWFALGVLFSMNLLNYVDRYVFSAVNESIRLEFGLSYGDIGILGGSFMVVYTIVSPLMGVLGDRYDRRRLLAFGVGLWSIATVGTAFSHSYNEMFFWRALLGIGEASYGVIAPALLADLFEPRRRGRVMGIFYLALPLGTALGFGVGGLVAKFAAWRGAFLVVGIPGLVVALLGLRILDPGRGASEGKAGSGPIRRPSLRDYMLFFRNRSFLFNTAGMAGVTFTMGAVALYGSNFYQKVHGMTQHEAGIRLGVLLAVGGLIGILMGTWIADLMAKRTRRAYMIWASIAVSAAVPLGLVGLMTPVSWQSLAYLFACSVLMSSVLGPCNTVTANVVPAAERATGFALSIFLIHIFGDISSQLLVGHLSDWLGLAHVAASPLGKALAGVGATPILGKNLRGGLLSVAPALVLSAIFFGVGSIFLAKDQDKARDAGGGGEFEAGAFPH